MIALFGIGGLLVFYVIVLYPILLEARARFAEKAVVKRFEPRTVSVVIPVRNGKPWIARKLDSVLALDYPRELLEIIVVSDGSDDGADAVVERYADRGVELVRVPRGGKPAALNAGIARSSGKILFLTDVRQPLDRQCLKRLVDCFADPSVGAASGDMVVVEGESRETRDVGLYWRYERWIRTNLSRVDSMLGATGPVYALRRELAVELPADLILDDMYLPLKGFLQGKRLVLEPGAIAYDYPTALDSEFRRKVRTQAGLYQLLGRMPELLGPRNRMWLDFMSLKLGRLALPWAMLAVLVGSFGLPAPWGAAALVAQGAFYLLAALDGFFPEKSLPRALTSPARAFVTLLAAPVFALRIFFVPPQSLWKETRVEKTQKMPLS